MDFFTVPTLTFSVLYCFFVIAHDRRRILHFNVTQHPSSVWVIQQLREAFPYDSAPSYLIFDRGTNFNEEVIDRVKSFGIEPKRTSFRSPWQNGVAERWVGSCRRDLIDHVIVVNQRHLKRLMLEYIRYYHEDRTHLALKKEHLQAVKLWRPLIHIVESYRLQGLAVCIIVMIWPPELGFAKTPRSSRRDAARDVVANHSPPPWPRLLDAPRHQKHPLLTSGNHAELIRSEKLIFS